LSPVPYDASRREEQGTGHAAEPVHPLFELLEGLTERGFEAYQGRGDRFRALLGRNPDLATRILKIDRSQRQQRDEASVVHAQPGERGEELAIGVFLVPLAQRVR
jgi:hypothetical protein